MEGVLLMPITSPTSLQEQQLARKDRIADLLRQATSETQPRNVFDETVMNMNLPGASGSDIFYQHAANRAKPAMAQADMEKQVYDLFSSEEARQNADVAAVNAEIDKYAGGDPSIAQKIFGQLNALPDDINASNAPSAVARIAASMGLQTYARKVDDREYGLKARQLDIMAGKTGRGTQRDRDIIDLMERGLSRSDAEDMAAGRVALTSPDQFGNVYLVNKVTGVKKPVGGGSSPPAQSAQPSPDVLGATPMQTKMPSIQNALRTGGTGALSNAAAMLEGTAGQVAGQELFPDVTQKRQQVRTFTQMAKVALVNNDKFPVAEQQIVAKLLPDPDAVFVNPQAEARKFYELHNALTQMKQMNNQTLSSGVITTDTRGKLTDKNAEIDRILGLMGEIQNPDQMQGGNALSEIDAILQERGVQQ